MSRARSLIALQQGTRSTVGEVLDWTYYDTITLDAGTSVHRAFTVPVSGTKTLNLTNMTVGGQIPQGQHLTVHALKLQYTTHAAVGTSAVAAIYQMLHNTTLEIVLPGKDVMGQWTLKELLGAATLIALTPSVAGDNIPLIQPRYHGVFPLNTPLVLAALTVFEVRVQHHVAVSSALNGDWLMVGLNGKLRRLS